MNQFYHKLLPYIYIYIYIYIVYRQIVINMSSTYTLGEFRQWEIWASRNSHALWTVTFLVTHNLRSADKPSKLCRDTQSE